MQAIMKKERRDVIKTKKAITNAYIDLLFENGDGKITVNQILDKADICRGTFYSHYSDINALHEYVINYLTDTMREHFKKSSSSDLKSSTGNQVCLLIERLDKYKDSLATLIKSGKSTKILKTLNTVLLNSMPVTGNTDYEIACSKIRNACIAGAFLDAYGAWVINDTALSLDEVSGIITKFLGKGLNF